jgi:hypothetical protein
MMGIRTGSAGKPVDSVLTAVGAAPASSSLTPTAARISKATQAKRKMRSRRYMFRRAWKGRVADQENAFCLFNWAGKQYKCHTGKSRYLLTFKAPIVDWGWIPGQARNDGIHRIFRPDH